jgi:hypothetical protein
MPAVGLRIRRVVFGIADAAAGGAAITTALELAQAFAVDLYGLFIEDALVFDAAASPHLRTIEPPALTWRVWSAAENAEAHALAARALERRLLDAAAALGIGAVFQIVRGDPAAALTQRLEPSDLLVFPEPADAMVRALPPYPRLVQALRDTAAVVLYIPHGRMRRSGPVVVFAQSDDDRAVALASSLALALHERLVVQAIASIDAVLLAPVRQRARLLVVSRAAAGDDMAGYVQLARQQLAPLLLAPAN